MRKNRATQTTDHFPGAGKEPSTGGRVSNATPAPTTVADVTTLHLPPGADPDVFDDWDGGGRVVWSHPMPLPEGTPSHWDIRVAVVQLEDGTIVADGTDQPVVYLNGDESKTVPGARALATALLEAADLAEQWAGITQEASTEEDSPPHVLLVEQNDQGTDRCEVVCRPFEPHYPGYDGQRYLSIVWDGTEESFVVVSRNQAAELARMLTGGVR